MNSKNRENLPTKQFTRVFPQFYEVKNRMGFLFSYRILQSKEQPPTTQKHNKTGLPEHIRQPRKPLFKKPRRPSHATALTPFIFIPQRTRTERARRRTDMSIH